MIEVFAHKKMKFRDGINIQQSKEKGAFMTKKMIERITVKIVRLITILTVVLSLYNYFPKYFTLKKVEDIKEDSYITVSMEANDVSAIPVYSGAPYCIINDNKAFFTTDEITAEVFENYSELDALGRCGVAYANLCKELMPTEKRESIGMIKPTGWHQNKYDIVSDNENSAGYLYNRCHLIGFQLAGENANEKNLITGTRYFNVTGMLPFEDQVADYVKQTNNHVLFRVTPVFFENNLLATGVLMEAKSVEDDSLEYCVFVYNVQPGITIDYETGRNFEQ